MSSEALRWLGSVGIFYVLVPVLIVVSDPFYEKWFPFVPLVVFSRPVQAAGCVAALTGGFLAFWSIRDQIAVGDGHPFALTGKENLARPTKRLLTHGVYYLCRNPMGLGDILLYGGLAVMMQLPYSLCINVPAYTLLVWYNHRFNERPFLIERFGAEYHVYERNTSCIFPGWRTARKYFVGLR